MKDIKYFNKASILTILTIGLAMLQTLWLHMITTDFAHEFFSVYFYIELAVFLLTIITGLRYKIALAIYLLFFLFESVWFFINERPISPDNSLMLIAGAIRIYIFIWLYKQYSHNKLAA